MIKIPHAKINAMSAFTATALLPKLVDDIVLYYIVRHYRTKLHEEFKRRVLVLKDATKDIEYGIRFVNADSIFSSNVLSLHGLPMFKQAIFRLFHYHKYKIIIGWLPKKYYYSSGTPEPFKPRDHQ